jgi:hypothetical protein
MAYPWNAAIPAVRPMQQESDLPFATESHHYRRPHSI